MKEPADRFYEAFSRRDGETMASLYADDITFSDPVFPHLEGKDAGDMWRMLCGRAKDLRIEYRVEASAPGSATVLWHAWYTFKTGRKVHNIVRANLRIRDGKITAHVDDFNFRRWARQAFGPAGWILGWLPPFQAKVRAEAARSLALFQGKQ